MKVRLSDVVVREREVTLPEDCPGCAAKLDTDEAIDAVGLDWNFGDGVVLPIGEDHPRGAQCVEPMGYMCRVCGHLLAWGKLAVIDAPTPEEEQRSTWSRGLDQVLS